MRKYYLFTALLFICHYQLSAQNPIQERLNIQRKVLTTLKGSERVDTLNAMAQECLKYCPGWVLSTIARADSAYPYAMQANLEAKQFGYVKGIAYSYARLAAGELFKSNEYQYLGKPQVQSVLDKWEEYAKKAIPFAEKLGDNNLLGQQYGALGELNFRRKDFNAGADNYKKAITYYKLAGNEIAEAESCTQLCWEYSGKGEFDKGFEYCERSNKLSQSIAQKNTDINNADYYNWVVQQSFVSLAEMYNQAGDYEMALSLFNKGTAYHKTGSSMTTDMSINKGKTFLMLGNFDSSLQYLKTFESRRTLWTGGENNMEAKILLSQAYLLSKNNSKALKIITECIDTLRKQQVNKLGNNYQLGKALTVASGILLHQKNYKLALQYANEGFELMKKNVSRVEMMNSYNLLSNIYHSLQKNDSAYTFLSKYILLKDSIQNKQFLFQLNKYKKQAEEEKISGQIKLLQKDNLIKQQQLQQQILLQQKIDAQLSLLNKNTKIKNQQLLIKDQELQIKDQTLKEQTLQKERQRSQLTLLDKGNKLKDQQLKQQSFVRNALIGGLLLFLLLGIFVFRSLSLKQKNERLQNEKKQAELQQLSTDLEMQALRAQMNPHFIFNCLSSINKFILKNESRVASDYLTRFSRLIRRVLTNSQLSMIPLSDEIEMLKLYLDMERLRFDNAFDYNIVYANTIEPETIYIPPMLLQPFCENAIWHGLMHKEAHGKLQIKMRTENNELLCTITDNGIGREKAAALKSKSGERQKSFGLKITTERLALFNNDKFSRSYYLTEDILDEQGDIAGTKVNLVIKYKEAAEQPVNTIA